MERVPEAREVGEEGGGSRKYSGLAPARSEVHAVDVKLADHVGCLTNRG